MRSFFLTLALCLWTASAFAQLSLTGVGGGFGAAAGCSAGTFGVDPNAGAIAPIQNTGAGTSIAATISTTNCPDEIIIEIATNGTISSVTSAHLTFTQRSSSGAQFEYVAQASGTLTSESITVATTASAFISVGGAAITGIHAAGPFDTNALIPNPDGSGCHWTTTNANDYLVIGENANDTVNAGWTTIAVNASDFLTAAGKKVTATQSALPASNALANGALGPSICDALIQGP